MKKFLTTVAIATLMAATTAHAEVDSADDRQVGMVNHLKNHAVDTFEEIHRHSPNVAAAAKIDFCQNNNTAEADKLNFGHDPAMYVVLRRTLNRAAGWAKTEAEVKAIQAEICSKIEPL